MGIAAQKIVQFQATKSRADSSREWVLEGRKVARAGADILYERLLAACQTEVEVFAKGLPGTVAANLICQSNGKASFNVQTPTFPIVNLEVTKGDLGVTARLSTHKDALGSAKAGRPSLYRFAADSNLQPCFSDGDQEFSPEVLADLLLEPVFDFFAPTA